MRLNFDNLLTVVTEEMDASRESRPALARWRRKTGRRTYSLEETIRDRDVNHIHYLSEVDEKARNASWTVCHVLQMNREQIERLYKAARAVRKWSEATDWQLCLSYETLSKLEKYVSGEPLTEEERYMEWRRWRPWNV